MSIYPASPARARDIARAIGIAAAGAGRLDGPIKYSRVGRVLQPIMMACVLLNAAVATSAAGIAGELYVSRTAIFVLGLRGPNRSRRSQLSTAAGGVLLLLVMLLPGLIVGVAVSIMTGDNLQSLIAATSTSSWMITIVVVWTALGIIVQLTRTEAYRQGYRDGVPASYWLLSSAASLRRGGGGFAFASAEVQRIVPACDTVVTVARTRTLEKIYKRYGFRPVRPHKLVLVRP